MPRILVIDDSPEIQLLLRAELEHAGYQVETAATGQDGLRLAQEQLPDLVLLDARLPEIDGYTVCKQIKDGEQTGLIPVVLLTALIETAARIKGLEAGADDFLAKPFHRAELLARVRSLLRIRELWLAAQKAQLERISLEHQLEKETERREREAQVRLAYAAAIAAVSNGKLQLFEDEQLDELLIPEQKYSWTVSHPDDLSVTRKSISTSLGNLGLDKTIRENLVLAASEAITNAIQHAGGGEVRLHFDGEKAQLYVSDKGGGIDFNLLPKATLVRGFSTKSSLGLGFTFMLELCSRVLLNTSPKGTTVILEMKLESDEEDHPYMELAI